MAIKLIQQERVYRNAKENRCWHDGWKAVSDWNERMGDDTFVVFENTERITYAVYYKHLYGGKLVGMLKHARKALDLDPDDEFDEKLLDVCRQEALDEGFPPYHPGTLGTIDTGEINGCRIKGTERWDKQQVSPFISVRCGYGRIVAHVVGDEGIYDDMAIDLVDDDGRVLQLATVTCYEQQEFDRDTQPQLKVLAWDGRDDDCSIVQTVEVDSEAHWLV